MYLCLYGFYQIQQPKFLNIASENVKDYIDKTPLIIYKYNSVYNGCENHFQEHSYNFLLLSVENHNYWHSYFEVTGYLHEKNANSRVRNLTIFTNRTPTTARFGAPFKSSATYASGDCVYYSNKFYQCLNDGTTGS